MITCDELKTDYGLSLTFFSGLQLCKSFPIVPMPVDAPHGANTGTFCYMIRLVLYESKRPKMFQSLQTMILRTVLRVSSPRILQLSLSGLFVRGLQYNAICSTLEREPVRVESVIGLLQQCPGDTVRLID